MQKKQKRDLVCSLVLCELAHFILYQCTPGKIPLRNLVYRVQELPPSMKPLVYDFGQLKEDQEERYISHIVNNNVSASTLRMQRKFGTKDLLFSLTQRCLGLVDS